MMWWKHISIQEMYTRPTFFYSREMIRTTTATLRQAMGKNWSIYYAMKANPNQTLLQLLRAEGLVDGIDVASIGEYQNARRAGFHPSQLSVTGPMKSRDFLRVLTHDKVGCICVESMEELQELHSLGGLPAGEVLLRINPKQEARAFQLKISGRAMPFGIDEETIPEVVGWMQREKISIDGIHIHAGSQCFSARGFAYHCGEVLRIATDIMALGASIDIVNIGGGLGIGNWVPLQKSDVFSVGRQLEHVRRKSGYHGKLRMEPGRYIVAEAGVYANRVHRIKHSRGTYFVILEGGTNHLGMLKHPGYQTKRVWIENLHSGSKNGQSTAAKVQLVGPLCTPLDMLGGAMTMPVPSVDDVLLFVNVGAYGLCMSPAGFLQHPLPNELWVDHHLL